MARDQHGWDLAQLCIETCSQPIERLAAACRPDVGVAQEEADQQTTNGFHHMAMGAARLEGGAPAQQQGVAIEDWQTLDPGEFPVDLDIPWDHLWETSLEPWQTDDVTYA